MDDTSSSSSSNEQEGPQVKIDFNAHAHQEWQPATSPELLLEDQIAHRAQEISSRNGVDPRRSLATWLEAAKEVLAKDFEKPN